MPETFRSSTVLWKQRDNGGIWIIIDPRETPTARQGDLHLQLKTRNWCRRRERNSQCDDQWKFDWRRIYQKSHSRMGRDQAKPRNIRPKSLPGNIGRSRWKIIKLPEFMVKPKQEWFLRAESNIIQTARKMFWAISISCWQRGKIGGKGRGYGTITGQGNGQVDANTVKSRPIAGYRSILNPEHRKYVADIWDIDETEMPQTGVSQSKFSKNAWRRNQRFCYQFAAIWWFRCPYKTKSVNRWMVWNWIFVCIDFLCRNRLVSLMSFYPERPGQKTKAQPPMAKVALSKINKAIDRREKPKRLVDFAGNCPPDGTRTIFSI